MTPSARRRFIVMLGLISALGPLSIDLYLPSLPAIVRQSASPAVGMRSKISRMPCAGEAMTLRSR